MFDDVEFEVELETTKGLVERLLEAVGAEFAGEGPGNTGVIASGGGIEVGGRRECGGGIQGSGETRAMVVLYDHTVLDEGLTGMLKVAQVLRISAEGLEAIDGDTAVGTGRRFEARVDRREQTLLVRLEGPRLLDGLDPSTGSVRLAIGSHTGAHTRELVSGGSAGICGKRKTQIAKTGFHVHKTLPLDAADPLRCRGTWGGCIALPAVLTS